jgi:hypothetical protein
MMPTSHALHCQNLATLPPTVAEIGKIHFEGNIIPHTWYQQITLESGKPDLPAITILAELVYWYRPYQTLTKGGKPLLKKHFDGDMFQCTAAYFSSKFGFTKDQVRKALKRMEDAGYIHREYRYIVQQGILRNNIMFIEPVPLAIMAITHPGDLAKNEPVAPILPLPVGDTLSPVGDTLSPVGDIFICIETTTEISTETTTTPQPLSSNDETVTTEPACGGCGNEDQNPEDQVISQERATAEATEEKTGIQEEVQPAVATTETSGTTTENQKTVASEVVIEEQRPELTFPAKLTEREYHDMATVAYLLPLLIAQQMLDVVAAKMKAGQIRTNPAAVLRGIVRKYKADPASFDPSMGFAIADARRRRAEAEAEAIAQAEQREREREASRITPASRDVAHRSIAHIKELLRSHA